MFGAFNFCEMRKIEVTTTCKRMLADVFTPVGIYLRLRDRFRDTILLESTDHHSSENSYSFICINAIGGIEISSKDNIEFKLPGLNPEKVALKNTNEVPQLLWNFMLKFDVKEPENICRSEYSFITGINDKTIDLLNDLFSVSPFLESNINGYDFSEGFNFYFVLLNIKVIAHNFFP